MLPELRAMMVLQDRDRRLLALAKDLERLGPEAERIKSKLAADEASLKKCHDTLVDCDLRLKRLELDAGTRRTTIQRLKTQQFETRKNEEYQALGHEILRYEKELDELETRELELMEEMDTHRAALKKAEQALQVSRERVDSELASIDEKRKRLEADRADVSSEREKLSADVPEDTLPLYERL
ncbi:MAG: zinc ribbon domain-containing protein, partial [Luteolibacter sp.]